MTHAYGHRVPGMGILFFFLSSPEISLVLCWLTPPLASTTSVPPSYPFLEGGQPAVFFRFRSLSKRLPRQILLFPFIPFSPLVVSLFLPLGRPNNRALSVSSFRLTVLLPRYDRYFFFLSCVLFAPLPNWCPRFTMLFFISCLPFFLDPNVLLAIEEGSWRPCLARMLPLFLSCPLIRYTFPFLPFLRVFPTRGNFLIASLPFPFGVLTAARFSKFFRCSPRDFLNLCP